LLVLYFFAMCFFFFFFFSSRRRHTRSYGDWSSDVCSSDLCYLRQRIPCRGAEKRRIKLPRYLVHVPNSVLRHRQALFPPAADTTIHRKHIGVAHLLQIVSS